MGKKDPGLVEQDYKYEIRLEPDPAARTVTIRDTGIGMSREELIDKIGTIARSATRELRKKLKAVAIIPIRGQDCRFGRIEFLASKQDRR